MDRNSKIREYELRGLLKEFFKFLVLLGLVASAWATTTVTGNTKNLGTSSLGGVTVRFYLRGCAGNQPRVNGVGILTPTQGSVWYQDFVSDSSGNISGTLYSTRDVTGNNGGEIECGGSTTAVWYGMVVISGGKTGPEVPVHAKSTATIDISNVTPITTNPIIASPTGDGTYARVDAGNQPFTGTVQAPSGKIVNAGLFTNTQMNLYLRSLLNSCDPSTEFQIAQGSNFDTEALTGCVSVPNGSTVLGAAGVAGYAKSANGITTAPMGGYFQSRVLANNGRGWGANMVVSDSPGGLTTGVALYGIENDCDPWSPASAYGGIICFYAVLNAGAGATGNLPATAFYAGNGAPNFAKWANGFMVNDNVVWRTAFDTGAACTSGSCASQPIQFDSYNGGVRGNYLLTVDSGGNLVYGGTSTIVNRLSFPTGLGAVSHIVGPTDQALQIASSNNKNIILAPNGAGTVQVNNGLNMPSGSRINQYDGQTLAAEGVPAVVAATIQKSETGADASLLSFTPASGTYRITFNLTLSAANTATLGWTVSWQDDNGNTLTPTNLSLFQSGTAAPALTFTTSATTANYYGNITIDAANSPVTVKLTFSGTSFTGKASAYIERIN